VLPGSPPDTGEVKYRRQAVDPNNRSGDWQQGGAPITPNAIFGTWNAAVQTVDNTKTPSSSGGVDPVTYPTGTVCANGCCLPDINIG
jgi:hypothetical protein